MKTLNVEALFSEAFAFPRGTRLRRMAGRVRISRYQSDADMGDAMADVGMPRRRRELLVFLFLTVVLAPMLAVAIVGGYGFMVWMYQLFAGPPGS